MSLPDPAAGGSIGDHDPLEISALQREILLRLAQEGHPVPRESTLRHHDGSARNIGGHFTLDSAWVAWGEQPGDWFGFSAASAGDVNDDGFDDIVIGAFFHQNGETQEGRAYVFHGSPDGLSATPSWTAEGDESGAWFGFSVAGAGDVDRDGFDDVIVGAVTYDTPQGLGRAFLYQGSPSGLSQDPAWTADGNQGVGAFGYSVASAGDVNDDGYADVVVGASAGQGRVFVYHGSEAGLSPTPDWIKDGSQAGENFGAAVAGAGDVNGDGYDDALIGSRYYSGGDEDEGRVYLFLGSDSGLALTASWTAEGDQEGAHLGQSVACAGDVNGDDYADVLAGAPRYSGGQPDEGQVRLYLGGPDGPPPSPDWTVESNHIGEGFSAGFGFSVAFAGDIDGDLLDDVLVGADNLDYCHVDDGAAFLYLGTSSIPAQSTAWEGKGVQAGAAFGVSVATAGNVNGGDLAEVIVGAPHYSPRSYELGVLEEAGAVFVYTAPMPLHDRDCDGLPNDWETDGVPIPNTGGTYTLPSAEPLHKDLYVELDAMEGLGPQSGVLESVVEAFANAPVWNPDGETGVSLHFIGDDCDPCADEEDIPVEAWDDQPKEDYLATRALRFGTVAERGDPNHENILAAKALAFRYGVFAHSIGTTGYTGKAEVIGFGSQVVGGDDFMVTMGLVPEVTANEQAATLMHELGHTLSLLHGGSDELNHKPNYYSVMNYTWQLPIRKNLLGGTPDVPLERYHESWRLDFSRQVLPTLNESFLVEDDGIGGDVTLWVPVGPPVEGPFKAQLVRMGGPVDWNRSLGAGGVGVAADVNRVFEGHPPSDGDALLGSDDWSHLQYPPYGDIWGFREETGLDDAELTFEEFILLSTLRFDCNGNDIYDDEEIDQGLVADENENGIPDECEETNSDVLEDPIGGPSNATIRVLRCAAPGCGMRTVEFSIPDPGPVAVHIIDVGGRCVATLIRATVAAGTYETHWDGLNARGSPAASGIYFAVLTLGDQGHVAGTRFVHVR